MENLDELAASPKTFLACLELAENAAAVEEDVEEEVAVVDGNQNMSGEKRSFASVKDFFLKGKKKAKVEAAKVEPAKQDC